ADDHGPHPWEIVRRRDAERGVRRHREECVRASSRRAAKTPACCHLGEGLADGAGDTTATSSRMTWPAWLEASHRRSLRLRDHLRQDKRLAGAVGGWPAAEAHGARAAAIGPGRADPL